MARAATTNQQENSTVRYILFLEIEAEVDCVVSFGRLFQSCLERRDTLIYCLIVSLGSSNQFSTFEDYDLKQNL